MLFTFKLGFIQIRGFKDGWNRTFGGLFSKKGDAGKDGMSSFQALATAIAAQVGTGNIAGAATAIAVGGPGAIFWMWISAFLGMSTIFAEAVMAQKFKQVSDDGTVTGGPVYYIRGAFKGTFGKVLAAIFAVLIIFALGFMGNAVQSNSIAASWNTAFGIPKIAMGIFVAVVSLFVFTGGMKRIAKVTELIVPIMAAFYIVGSLIVIFANVTAIPAAFHDIIVGAFKPAALVIITTGSRTTGLTGAQLSQYAFSTLYGKFGEIFIAICMLFFAFSTIIGWYFFGEANIRYLFGAKAVKIYSIIVCICVALGSLQEVELVWNMADCFNSMMVIPNAIALVALSGLVKKTHDDYYNNFLPNQKKGK